MRLFIKSSGYNFKGSLDNESYRGCYWASDHDTKDYAYYVYFLSSYVSTCFISAGFTGFPIHPILN